MIMIPRQNPAPNRLSSLPWVRTIRSAVAHHKWKGCAFFVFTVASIAAVILLFPNTYASETKLIVRVGRESVTLDPTATSGAGETITVNDSRETEINSVLDVIESRVILEQVVDQLGLDAILTSRAADPKQDREKAILQLQRAIKTTHVKKSNVLTIKCKARTPELAQQIAQAFLDAFLAQHLRINRTAGSYEFFVTQTERLNEQLISGMRQLSQAKNELDLISVDGQKKSIQDQISAIETSKLTTESSLAASEATIASLRTALAGLPERLVTEEVTGFPNGAGDTTRQQLYQFRIREKELLSKYTAEHPLLVGIQQQAREAEQILTQREARSAQSTSSTNPSHQDLHLKLLTEESQTAALRAQTILLAEQHGRLRQQLRDLNDQEGHISQLERSVDLLQVNHRAYAEKLEQARIDQALEFERISNVNIVQPPTFVLKPVSPKRGLILAAGLFVALLGAVGVIGLCEYTTHALQNSIPPSPQSPPKPDYALCARD